jgi:hypothetical protein
VARDQEEVVKRGSDRNEEGFYGESEGFYDVRAYNEVRANPGVEEGSYFWQNPN